MENNTPLILITNDDSIAAPGIHALAEIMRGTGEIYIVAPAEPHSGQSAALTVGAPLRIDRLPDRGDGIHRYTVSGTPVDCIKLAMHAIVPRRPDLVLSGINHGSNSGTAIVYSGTMGAVQEACMLGIPAVGFSLLHHSMQADFSLCTEFVADIAMRVLRDGLPQGTCLNVNIPARVIPRGVRVCRSARGHWTEEYVRYEDPSGKPFYWLTGRFVNAEPEATDTDEYWLDRNYISVVPVDPSRGDVAMVAPLAKVLDRN